MADKGYHSMERMHDICELHIRSYVAEPDRRRRKWKNKREQQKAVYANRRRIRYARGKELLRRRRMMLECPFAPALETGGTRRVFLGSRENVLKRALVHYATLNLALLLRSKFGRGTPRSTFAALDAQIALLSVLWRIETPDPAQNKLPSPLPACRHDRRSSSRLHSVGCQN